MKLAIDIVHEIAEFYWTSIEIEIFDCHSSKELEEYILSELEMIYDEDIDIESLEELTLQASMKFISNEDPDWLLEAVIRTQQLDFLYELRRTIYDLNIVFSEKDREDD
ncbi:hypothetical protein [Nonlabens sp. YIK11]|uniref:hypothetical protein n=1 Tax=Nonlabens sp. YIK11 TaxID=1453349 RepID=UPI000B207DCE|nr:hypothetical protein [Nonlabens sp. YIK11]